MGTVSHATMPDHQNQNPAKDNNLQQNHFMKTMSNKMAGTG